ncbi:MAG: SMC-Scp complex subunit ScpB [Thermoplasmataceae archaeon]
MTLSARIEALLYASENPLSILEISSVLIEQSNSVKKELNRIMKKMNDEDSGIFIARIGNRYKMTIKNEYRDIVGPVSASELNRMDLKIVGFIASRERTIKGDLRRAFGDKYVHVIKTLKEKGLINGRKERNTESYSVTNKFYKYFNVKKEEFEKIASDLKESEDVN